MELKRRLTSLDVAALARELGEQLKDCRILNVYHKKDDETLFLKIRLGEENRFLVIHPESHTVLTKYEYRMPSQLTEFAKTLRRRIGNRRIRKLAQVEFDRILEIEIDGGSRLIVEHLPRYNIILESDGEITAVLKRRKMRDRTVKEGERYIPPPSNIIHPLKIDARMWSERTVKEFLKSVGYFTPYMEEVAMRMGMDKDRDIKGIEKDLMKVVREIYMEAVNSRSPTIYYNGNKPVDVTPLELLYYEKLAKRKYATFNEAVDEYFITIKLLAEKRKREEEVAKLAMEKKRIIDSLERRLEILRERARVLRELGHRLMADLYEADRILRSGVSEKYNIVEVKNDRVRIEYKGVVIELRRDEKTASIVSSLFDEAKDLERDIRRIEERRGEIRRELEKLMKRREEIKVKKPRVKKKREWFEKFRWFISSDGILVIGGKDATTNEVIIRKYSREDEPVFHSDVPGAPFVVIKRSVSEVPENTFMEAAIEAASFTTKAWKLGYASLDVYWVERRQLSKTPPSGEYLSRGAFMVRGKRNYFKGVPLKLAVGVFLMNGEEKVMVGPERAVYVHCGRYVEIVPEGFRKSELAKRIHKILTQWGYEIDLNELMEKLPAGGRIL